MADASYVLNLSPVIPVVTIDNPSHAAGIVAEMAQDLAIGDQAIFQARLPCQRQPIRCSCYGMRGAEFQPVGSPDNAMSDRIQRVQP